MSSLGILLENEENLNGFFYDFAIFAHKHDLKVCCFTPKALQPDKEFSEGLLFNAENCSWEKKKLPLPDFFYNQCVYFTKKDWEKHHQLLKELSEKCTFLNTFLPDKWTLHQIIQHNPSLKPYLPYTAAAKDVRTIIKALEEFGQVLLKPVFSSRGIGIFVLEKQPDSYRVRAIKNMKPVEMNISGEKLGQWLKQLTEKQDYLVQPCLQLLDQTSKPFDLRVLLQKSGDGKWTLRGKSLRFGNKNGIVSTIASGGTPVSYESWKKNNPIKRIEFIENEIQELAPTIPPLLETIFGSMFELGIDFGIDQSGAVWILEIQPIPGRTVFLNLYPNMYETLYQAPVLYTIYLIKNRSESGRSIDEKVLPD